jgi:hypothetical protein
MQALHWHWEAPAELHCLPSACVRAYATPERPSIRLSSCSAAEESHSTLPSSSVAGRVDVHINTGSSAVIVPLAIRCSGSACAMRTSEASACAGSIDLPHSPGVHRCMPTASCAEGGYRALAQTSQCQASACAPPVPHVDGRPASQQGKSSATHLAQWVFSSDGADCIQAAGPCSAASGVANVGRQLLHQARLRRSSMADHACACHRECRQAGNCNKQPVNRPSYTAGAQHASSSWVSEHGLLRTVELSATQCADAHCSGSRSTAAANLMDEAATSPTVEQAATAQRQQVGTDPAIQLPSSVDNAAPPAASSAINCGAAAADVCGGAHLCCDTFVARALAQGLGHSSFHVVNYYLSVLPPLAFTLPPPAQSFAGGCACTISILYRATPQPQVAVAAAANRAVAGRVQPRNVAHCTHAPVGAATPGAVMQGLAHTSTEHCCDHLDTLRQRLVRCQGWQTVQSQATQACAQPAQAVAAQQADGRQCLTLVVALLPDQQSHSSANPGRHSSEHPGLKVQQSAAAGPETSSARYPSKSNVVLLAMRHTTAQIKRILSLLRQQQMSRSQPRRVACSNSQTIAHHQAGIPTEPAPADLPSVRTSSEVEGITCKNGCDAASAVRGTPGELVPAQAVEADAGVLRQGAAAAQPSVSWPYFTQKRPRSGEDAAATEPLAAEPQAAQRCVDGCSEEMLTEPTLQTSRHPQKQARMPIVCPGMAAARQRQTTAPVTELELASACCQVQAWASRSVQRILYLQNSPLASAHAVSNHNVAGGGESLSRLRNPVLPLCLVKGCSESDTSESDDCVTWPCNDD